MSTTTSPAKEVQRRQMLLAKERARIASRPTDGFLLDGIKYLRAEPPQGTDFLSMVKFRLGKIACELWGRHGKSKEMFVRVVNHDNGEFAWYAGNR